MTGGQKFCLRWDGFKSRLSSVFDELRREEELLDVTLCCDGGHAVKAHQILLSASSPSLRQLLKSNPCQHPVFFLKETSAEDLHAIIQFIYCGEVNVVQSQLASFIKTAEMLQIRGLSGDSDGDEDQTPTATAPRQSSAPPPREDDQPAPAEPRPSKRRRRRSSGTSDLSATYDASSSASAPASVTASSKTAAGVPAAASAAATASKSAIPSTSVSTDNRAVANVPKAASASVIAADVNVVSLDDIKTEQVDLSDDEGRSMDDPLGFFSSFEGHVDASSAAGPSSRDSHGGPSTAAGPSGQAGATAAGEPTAQEYHKLEEMLAMILAKVDFIERIQQDIWEQLAQQGDTRSGSSAQLGFRRLKTTEDFQKLDELLGRSTEAQDAMKEELTRWCSVDFRHSVIRIMSMVFGPELSKHLSLKGKNQKMGVGNTHVFDVISDVLHTAWGASRADVSRRMSKWLSGSRDRTRGVLPSRKKKIGHAEQTSAADEDDATGETPE
ncbi:longitudinals lacking protein, isoforms H/M/V-like isoform X7 [Amphibalanus amphitrite]|uniref:longitudinals lacking protein, isoforms H/M/V-like isoform X7 n=1 Tax=Amphibalanus amphitrite TaxID=1232801 RepID=UPI001C9172BB|nr:longitudinals lacking protein, isoforms H/M/V-like isoform X7 [Amphibalanus amphitrite]XP_043238976.1 longitudinals lacking protein, isoforms H/M/V-like isoform X7 [Amphibalanus amphitrite]